MQPSFSFSNAFQTLTGHVPFPWQQRLYQRFVAGEFPETCSLPTGLGKTSVIPIWLLALAAQPDVVPRRLVYVVNRRTVVDQTTSEMEALRRNLTTCEPVHKQLQSLCASEHEIPLAISTLRGQFADNEEWLADPMRPAIVAGTVDMIGSRLLFSGYRCGWKSKPRHAGMLGQEALLIHDEAHLEPAFQHLLTAIVEEQTSGRFPDVRPLKVIELSATNRTNDEPFRLQAEDFDHAEVQRRIKAVKSLHLHPLADEKQLASTMLELALAHRDSGKAVLVFGRTVELVEKIESGLRKALHKTPLQNNVQVLVGTMRGKERDALVDDDLFQRFLNKNKPTETQPLETVWLVCTSAGEVGVNLSADHLVCDLSTFDSMAQRFGRVNRFGHCEETQIDVVHPIEFPTPAEIAAKPVLKFEQRRQRTLLLLQRLDGNASPQQLEQLPVEDRLQAFTPDPDVLPTSEILFDAWSLTTIREPLPGRPPVQEYLHGVAEWEPPRTQVAWREEVKQVQSTTLDWNPGLIEKPQASPAEQLEDLAAMLLQVYPVKPHELLEDNTDRVQKHLKAVANRVMKHAPDDAVPPPAWIVDSEGTVQIKDIKWLADADKEAIENCLVLLPPAVGGLSQKGRLDGTTAATSEALDVADEWMTATQNVGPVRQRLTTSDPQHRPPSGMREAVRILLSNPDPDDAEETPTLWQWCVPSKSADAGHSWIAFKQRLDEHLTRARAFAQQLHLPSETWKEAVVVAAGGHDLGKNRDAWQRSIGNHAYDANDPATILAKSGGGRSSGLTYVPYRHEFGSLLDVQLLPEFQSLDETTRDLALHLIATHHGRARPHFPAHEIADPQHAPERVTATGLAVLERFARLQRVYGRWGLAWLENLVHAADVIASTREEGENP